MAGRADIFRLIFRCTENVFFMSCPESRQNETWQIVAVLLRVLAKTKKGQIH